MQKHVFVIAEAGVNHNGSLTLAYQLVDAAKAAGADCVKFQTYITDNDTAESCEKAEYQKNGQEESQYQLLKRLNYRLMIFENCRNIVTKKKYCFYQHHLILRVFFLESIQMPVWKIASSEVENFQLLREVAKTHKPVILSTGMCRMDEIEAAVNVLRRFGTEKYRYYIVIHNIRHLWKM